MINHKINSDYEPRVLAIIPARGGSKGLKNKNILELNGHPLIAYSIEAALLSKYINKVICSTDSIDIKKIAIKYGAEAPFLRPKKISGDLSTDLECFEHAIDWLKKNENYEPDLIVQLRPTSPLRTISMIDEAIKIMLQNDAYTSLRAICHPQHTPHKMWVLNENNSMSPLLKLKNNKEPFNTNRQLLPEVFIQTGSIDITRTSTIKKLKSMTGKKIFPYIVNESYFVDIDDIEMLRIASLRIKNIDCINFKGA